MKVLMYLLYGENNHHWQEAKFSIITARRFINQESLGFKIVVCTDQPVVADSVDYKADVPKNPLTERVIIHLKSQMCGWSSLYRAVCLAVLSGTVQRKKAGISDEAVQAIWRQHALTWLEDELTIWENDLQAGRLSAPRLRKKLEHWLKDKDLAVVREPFALTKFSESEHKKWTAFWHKVNKFLASID